MEECVTKLHVTATEQVMAGSGHTELLYVRVVDLKQPWSVRLVKKLLLEVLIAKEATMKPFGTGAHLAHVPVVQNVKIYGEIVQEAEVTTDHGNVMQNTKQVSVRFL